MRPHVGALRALPAKHIVRAIADAAERWRDADFPPRVRATRAVMQRLTYTEPVVDYALDRLFHAITSDAIEATIAGELGTIDALDGFVRRPGRPALFARGAPHVTIVSSQTTIGVAIPPMLFALCAKSDVVVKDRADELVRAFAQTLAQEEPAFESILHVDPWEAQSHPAAHPAITGADVLVAFGSDAAMQAIRAACKPTARFLPFGHRTSVAYIPRESLADESLAKRCARDVAVDALLYDGEGCLSLHAVFAEEGASVSPGTFAALLAGACDAVAIEFPAAERTFAPEVAAYRDRVLFRATLPAGAVYVGAASPHLVVFAPPWDEPPPLLARTIGVYPVRAADDLLSYTRAHNVPLEAVARPAHGRAELDETLAETGASRIAPLGTLQDPPLTGNHGGEGRITPFVSLTYRDDG